MIVLRCLQHFVYCNRFGFSAVGVTAVLLVTSKFFLVIFDGFRAYILPRIVRKNLKQYGKWAIVTGSTDGIGKSYARQLAKRKIDLILISRNSQRLIATAHEIGEEFKVTVRTIQADFTDGWKLYGRIKESIANEDIGILVNNVGVMAPQPCYFLSLREEEIYNIINVNVCSLLLMTTIILPRLIGKRTGIVVNVCSLMSEFVTPLISCYGASKSLINDLSLALYWENKHTGVHVQTLVTSCVNTKLIAFSNIWKYLGFFVTNPDTYSESAVRTLGHTSVTTGYWGHSVQLLFKLMPKILQKYILFWFNLFLKR